MRIVRCQHCKAELFISEARAPVCGRCGTPLNERPARGVGGGFFAMLRSLFSGGPQQSPKPAAQSTAREPGGANLKPKVELLGKRAWGSREQVKARHLVLPPRDVRKFRNYDDYIGALLRHVSGVAPLLSVPVMRPRVSVKRLCDAAGQFVEEDGWVKIVVGANFFDKPDAARAILCHELCHYILGANGIRETTRDENERLTDVAMFVFGLGDIFLQGYQAQPGLEYRSGHRLGYLTDHEYRFVQTYVAELRRSAALQQSDADIWETRFRATVTNAHGRDRMIANYRQKYPGRSRAELIEIILIEIQRDNR